MSQPDDFVKEFLVESREGLDRLDGDLIALEENPRDLACCDSAFRALHTIKGNAGFLDFHRLGQLAHAGESVLQLIRGGALQLDATITDALLELLDALRRILVSIEKTASEGTDRFEDVEAKLKSLSEIEEASSSEPKGNTDSDAFTSTMTFTPEKLDEPEAEFPDPAAADVDMATIARPLPREHSRKSERDPRAKVEQPPSDAAERSSEEPKSIFEPVGNLFVSSDSAVEHGSSHTSGASSLVRVDCRCEPGIRAAYVHIEVADDGAGLDSDRIRQKAISRGLITAEQAEDMSNDELHPLLFAAGFSTSKTITSLSGRGVGLDVVRTNIEHIGGTVDIDSVAGQGTTIHITVPLTLAIVPALIIPQGEPRYAIPQVNVIELISLEGEEAANPGELFHNAPVFRLRGEVLPLLWLSEMFGRGIEPVAENSEDGLSIVVVQAGARRFALVVDGVSGTEEIVVKPIGSVLDGLTFYTGATIMGDGTVALILDILGVARHAGLLVRRQTAAEQSQSTITRPSDVRESLLVCSVGRRRIGLPLAEVARLTSVARDGIEAAGQSEVLQEEEELLRLIRTHQLLGEPAGAADSNRLPVVVHRSEHGTIGLIVDRILDIVEQPADSMEHSLGDDVQAVVVDGKVTDLIDVYRLLAAR